MNWNKWMRQTHRWISILFTLGVIINGVAVAMGKYNGWVGLMALLPLALLLLTGLYLFVLPYAAKWGSARQHGMNGPSEMADVGVGRGPGGPPHFQTEQLK
jgi:hypothetical protein